MKKAAVSTLGVLVVLGGLFALAAGASAKPKAPNPAHKGSVAVLSSCMMKKDARMRQSRGRFYCCSASMRACIVCPPSRHQRCRVISTHNKMSRQ